jgi:hypothetical protein
LAPLEPTQPLLNIKIKKLKIAQRKKIIQDYINK